MLSEGQYVALLNKVYRNMSMTPRQLAFIALNTLDKVNHVLIKENEYGVLEYEISWENQARKNVGIVEVD